MQIYSDWWNEFFFFGLGDNLKIFAFAKGESYML